MNALINALENYFNGYNKVKTVIIPRSKIVDREETFDILTSVYYDNYRHFSHDFDFISKVNNALETIGMEWSNHSGRFIARLMRALPEFSDFAGIIGDRITRRAYKSRDEKWLLSIADQIFWKDGNFGHDNSCWFGGYSESRDVFIDDACGIALLWHYNQDPFNGNGRVWIAPIRENREDLLFLFNQYGEVNGKTIRIEHTAKVLTQILPETNFISGELYNDTNGDIPYINGNNGMYIAPETSLISNGIEIHVEWGEDDSITCDNCGNRIDDDEIYTHGYRNYCESCYDELYTTCEYCGDSTYRDDAVYIESEQSYYCEYCADNHFTTCEYCGKLYANDTMTEIDRSNYCEDCLSDNFATCDDCNEYIPRDELIELDGSYYCESCNADEIEKTAALIDNLMDI